MASRATLFSSPGGDTVQILKTAESLRALGCLVDVSIESEPAVDAYDVVHVFNLTRPQQTYSQARAARRRGIPVVLSTIYVDYREVDRIARGPLQRLFFQFLPSSTAEYVKMIARALLNQEVDQGTALVLLKGSRRAQRALIEMAAILLPNSDSEARRVKHDFPESQNSLFDVVPNAVDPKIFNMDETSPIKEFENCVLCVGRIERRKCQLELVHAVKGTPLKLVIIGKPGPNNIRYFEQIKQDMGDNVTIIDHIDQTELPRYYASCKVHALVSWMETAGLSTLEAGYMGANVVITTRGDTTDYFGNLAYYCEPDSIESIRKALMDAYNAPRSPHLRERILEKYTWDQAAAVTLAAYRKIL